MLQLQSEIKELYIITQLLFKSSSNLYKHNYVAYILHFVQPSFAIIL